jgi:thioredoxin-like negative regulator of GroEL
MSSKEIISEIADRNAFLHLLQNNPGLIILKLGAEWCGPCKQIKNVVHAFFATSPPEVVCGDIDVDVSFDFYGFLKSRKMVNGIPVLLCYKKGNTNFIPDDSVTGADPIALDAFFKRCGNHLLNVKKTNPPRSTSRQPMPKHPIPSSSSSSLPKEAAA